MARHFQAKLTLSPWALGFLALIYVFMLKIVKSLFKPLEPVVWPVIFKVNCL